VIPNNALIHLGKLKNLEITQDCSFYNLKDDYGVVVYS